MSLSAIANPQTTFFPTVYTLIPSRLLRQAFYSVPSTLCPPGHQVEIGLGLKLVRIYHRGQLVKVHPRQPRGGRSTDPQDYPRKVCRKWSSTVTERSTSNWTIQGKLMLVIAPSYSFAI